MKILYLTFSALLISATASAVPVQITVTNVRNANGHVLAALCRPAEFLHPHCAYTASVAAHPGTVTINFSDISPETYAAQVFHDENDNKEIDRNFFGLPTEGIGFSNNAQFHFGPPSFSDAGVKIGSGGAALTIQLRYF